MVDGYFLNKDGYTSSKLEGGFFTLPANGNYSTTIFNISNATGNWNISGPNFSEAYVHTCIHVGYGVGCSVMSLSLLQQHLMFKIAQLSLMEVILI